MSAGFDYKASVPSILEYLLTDHSYRWEIARLSNREIERLRGMLHQAVEQRIPPEEIYEAITRGFEQAQSVSVSSPPLADDLRAQDAPNEKKLMEALLREISAA